MTRKIGKKALNLFSKLGLEDRPFIVSLLVLVAIVVAGLGVSSIFIPSPSAMPTALGFSDGTPCFQDSDCQSSFCTIDTDGSRFCAPSGSCARKEGTFVNTYPSSGPFSSDVADPDGVSYRCDMGFWSEDPFSSTHTFSRITFTEAGTDASTSFRVHKDSIVREASLYVYGLPSYQVNLETNYNRAGILGGYSVQVRQVAGESKIVLTDIQGTPIGTYEYSDPLEWLGYDFMITTASVDGKTKVILSARGQDTFAIYTIGKYQISNPKVDIGLNGPDWDHSGKLTHVTGPQKIDFTAELSSLLRSCVPLDGVCTIPISVSSEAPGTIILSNLKVVLNSPPKIISIGLDPAVATYGEAITCTASASDSDGDTVSYRYNWLRNGFETGIVSNILPPERAQKGDVWKCVATPIDPYSEGETALSSEVYISGLSDYSPCSADYQCESGFCVNGLCCFGSPCPGDNVCSVGEDGTDDDECCVPGDGTCTGGCSGIDSDCTSTWTADELRDRGAQILTDSTRNDRVLMVKALDRESLPLSRAQVQATFAGQTQNYFTNSEGYVAIPVEWGNRVVVSLLADQQTISTVDVVIEKTDAAEEYDDEELEKVGFTESAQIFAVEWTREQLESMALTISFPEKPAPGEPLVILIKDSQGNPVPRVPVTLETSTGFVTAVTNNLGLATIQQYPGDPLRVRVEKDGYTIATEEVTVVSGRIGYWALIPILVLIIPLIVFFVFSTARGRVSGFGAKHASLTEPTPQAKDVPTGMDTSSYAKQLHTMRQSPATAQVLEHLETASAFIAQRDYTGAQQELELSKKLYSRIKTGLKGDEDRIISLKLLSVGEEVGGAYKGQLEKVKHTPAAQKVLDHMKFVEGRIKEVQNMEAGIRKTVNAELKSVLTSTFVKKHPGQADTLLQEIEDTVQHEIYDELDSLRAHLNELRNNLIEAKSERVLSMEGMGMQEINRSITQKKSEIDSKIKTISMHFKTKAKSVSGP